MTSVSKLLINMFSMGAWFIVLAVFILLIGIAIYVANAIIMMNALKKIGYKHPWFVWIPFLSSYAIADLAKEDENGLVTIQGLKFDIKAYKFYWLLPTMIGSFSILFIPVGSIVGLVINACCGAICYKEFYSNFETIEKKNEWICYLTGVCPIIAPIKYLLCKNK